MKTFTSPSQATGKIGEEIACKWLFIHGFKLIERNYTRRWGEIDVIAAKDGVIHFIEVKSVTCESSWYRPEELVHPWKQRKLSRTIGGYLARSSTGKWQFDVICVHMDMQTRRARVRILEDIILG